MARVLDMNPAGLRMLEADSLEQVRNLLRLSADRRRVSRRLSASRSTRACCAGGSGVLEFEIVGLKHGRRWLARDARKPVARRRIWHGRSQCFGHHARRHGAQARRPDRRGPARNPRQHRRAAARCPRILGRIAPLAGGISIPARPVFVAVAGLRKGDACCTAPRRACPRPTTEAVDGLEIGDGRGSVRHRRVARERVVVADIATPPVLGDYRELALPHGLRACWSTPVIGYGRRARHLRGVLPRAARARCRASSTTSTACCR